MSEEFFREDVEALECRLRIGQNFRSDKGKECNNRNGTEECKVGNGYSEVSALVLVEPFECGP